jgi:uncharacterized membrane protein YfcA
MTTMQPVERSLPEERPLRYWSWWLLAFVAAWGIVYFAFMPAPVALLGRNWIFIPVGFLGAVVGNLSAIGGGIVFIPVMILIYGLPPVVALKVALASQCFGMTSGAIGWFQKGVVPRRALRLTLPGMLVGSTISSLVIHPNALLVKGLFGPFSILLGVLTFAFADRHAGRVMRTVPKEATIPLVLVSIAGGVITGWIAVGEGEVIAAFLMLVYGLDASACIGLGVMLLAFNSFYLTAIHAIFLGGIPWDIGAFTGFGCVFGARLAPFLGQRAGAIWLRKIFGAIAISDGVLFVVQRLMAGH